LDQATAIDNILRQIRRELDQLPYLITMLVDEPAEVKDVWHWQWDNLMESTEHLCELQSGGVLNEAQAHEFSTITQLLVKNRPWIEHLGCRLPRQIEQPADAPHASEVVFSGPSPDLRPPEDAEGSPSTAAG
jgi:hypothetical protein